MTIRILVVDDSVIFRQFISEIIRSISCAELIGTAYDGESALRKIRDLKPDLITLDIEMPGMSGLEVLKTIKQEKLNTAVVIVSSITPKGSAIAIDALEMGAFEVIPKPTGKTIEENTLEFLKILGRFLKGFIRHRDVHLPGVPPPSKGPIIDTLSTIVDPKEPTPVPKKFPRPEVVLIGLSTGGPVALSLLLPRIPKDFGIPIFIVQHMPPFFTQALAENLSRKCLIAVKEAQDGEIARQGVAYIAPGGFHMTLERKGGVGIVMKLSDGPPENGCRPSVDVLFRSAALNFPGKSLAAILTGMGTDGLLGAQQLKKSGCRIFAQNQATCAVYGMPKAIVDSGTANEILTPESMAREISKWK